MSKHIFKGLVTILMVTLLMVFTAVPVLAFDVRGGGDTVTVPRGEVVDGPLYVAANQSVTIDGTVNGGLRAASRTINVNGTVTGNVIAVGQTINITGEIGGDVIVGCVSLNVSDTAKIKGRLLFAAGIAQIEGSVAGGGSAILTGKGAQENGAFEAVSLAALLPAANIPGGLTHANGQSCAQFVSNAPESSFPAGGGAAIVNPFKLFSGPSGKFMGFLMALIAGLVIILVAPRRLASVTDIIRTRTGLSAAWGAIILIVTPVAAALVCLTIIGISVGIITLVLYGIALYLAKIPVSLLIGQLIIGRFKPVESGIAMFGAMALGLAIITLLMLIPYFGFLLGLAVIIFGLGAASISLKRCRDEGRKLTST